MGILTFVEATKEKEILDIFDHTIDAFSDSPDFNWTLKEIKQEIKDGWRLYGACLENENEVIAALFYKVDGDILHTKNTAIKMTHQGSGYSHQIKEFYEKKAREYKLKYIYHYCRIDNFRMYSLNESHGYSKSGKTVDPEGHVVEWIRPIS